MATISKKRKFVADGVFYAELNELLVRELAEDGYSGVDVRVTPLRTEIIIKATRTQDVFKNYNESAIRRQLFEGNESKSTATRSAKKTVQKEEDLI